jgi:hypothetical protein
MFLIVLGRTLELARSRLGTLFASGWGYMLLLLALNVAISARLLPDTGFTTGSYMTEPITDVGDEGRREAALRMLAVVANVVAGFSIGVAYLRRVLLGRREFVLAFGARNLRAGWKIVLLALIGTLVLIPMMFGSVLLASVTGPIGALLLFASPFVALMLVQRLSLVLPAAALDDPMTLETSWSLTRGIGIPIAVAALVVFFAVLTACGLWWGAMSLTGELVRLFLPELLPPQAAASALHGFDILRSALLPAGMMVLATWLFSSLHATTYALARERFVMEAGLRQQEVEHAEAARSHAARRAVSSVVGLGRDRARD